MPDDSSLAASTNTPANGGTQAAAAVAAPVVEAKPAAQPAATAVVTEQKPAATVASDAKPADVAKATEPAKPEVKPEAAKADATKPDAAAVVYDLKLPKESKLDAATAVEHVVALAKEMQLSPAQAQRLLTEQDGMLNELLSFQQEQHAALRKQWVDESKADKEIGGQAFDASVNRAKQAFAKYGSPAFEKMLNETGFGDNPEVLRVFSRIGKAMAEDSFATTAGTSQRSEEQILRARFPSMFQAAT